MRIRERYCRLRPHAQMPGVVSWDDERRNTVLHASRRTEHDYEGHAVRQWQYAAEAIEFWLNGWVSVHGVGMRWMPLRSLLPETAVAEES